MVHETFSFIWVHNLQYQIGLGYSGGADIPLILFSPAESWSSTQGVSENAS